MAVPSDTRPGASYGSTQVDVTATQLIGKTFPYNTIAIQNLGPNPIYVGWDKNVTSATGWKVPENGGTLNVDIFRDDTNGPDLFGVCPGGLQVTPLDTRYMAVR